MINNSDIKQINSLNRKKNRDESGLFIVEGEKNVQELLASDFEIANIYATSEWKGEINHIQISNKDLERISQLKNPNKVLAVVKKPKNPTLSKSCTSIVIDQINDPGNLGTIIRTADWFGIKQVICSQESVDVFNPKVVMASMGSVFRTKVIYKNLHELFQSSELPVYGALLEGVSIYETTFKNPCFLFLGSESHGISKELISYIQFKTTIPGNGTAESLNLGISTAIFASEYYRQTIKSSSL